MNPPAESTPCPKCGHKNRATLEACGRCGLTFSRWTPELAIEVVKLDDKAEALWADMTSAWQDETKHDAFLKYCSVAGILGAAGRRYREWVDGHPGDEIGTRMQQRVLTMATMTLATPKMPAAPVTRTKIFWIVLGVGGFAGILGALIFGRK